MASANADTIAAPNDSDLSDADLVVLARHNRSDFAQLYLRYADGIYRFALERTRSAALADDILSETMLAAMEALDQFDPERGRFASWLFTIARNRITTQQRYHRRAWRRLTQLRLPPAEDDPPDLVIRREEAARVRSALAQLSGSDQELLLLRYGGGLTSPEIGDVLGVSNGAVRARLSRALRRLAAELGDDDD